MYFPGGTSTDWLNDAIQLNNNNNNNKLANQEWPME